MKILLASAFIVLALSILPFARPSKFFEITNTDSSAASVSAVETESTEGDFSTSTQFAYSASTTTSTVLINSPLQANLEQTAKKQNVSSSTQARSSLSSKEPFQGDTVVINIFDKELMPESATFDGVKLTFFQYRERFIAVLPIPIDKKPGAYLLKISFANGETMERAIQVKKKNFPLVVLGIPEELGMTSNQLVSKLQSEKSKLMEILNVKAPDVFFNDSFIAPLDDAGKISSQFGELRKTGENEIRHLGIDFAAEHSAPVYAMNGGIVRDAYSDTVYGNSIILDHGQGIFSLYMHLDKMNVKKGDLVKRGDVIGAVGKTGYSTADHLHLSLKIGGVSVDPLQFIERFK